MCKEWLWARINSGGSAFCMHHVPPRSRNSKHRRSPTPPKPYLGPVVEIGGVEPQYEPYNPNNMQDYKINGAA